MPAPVEPLCTLPENLQPLPGSALEQGCRAEAVQPVDRAQNGMLPQHPQPCITHHEASLVAAGTLITVDRARGASRLLLTEPATLQAKMGVIEKSRAFRALCVRRSMVVPAENVDHDADRFPLLRRNLGE